MEICIPWKTPDLTAFIIALLSPSITIIKSRGERGNPWRSPFSEVKKGEATPFMSTMKETEQMQAINHLMKGTSNPRWVSRSMM